MNAQPRRNYTRLAAAIVLAALVIAAGIFASSYFGTARTVTQTNTTVTTQTVTRTLYGTSPSSAQTVAYPANVTLKYGKLLPRSFSVGEYSYDVVCDYEDSCTYVYNGSTIMNLGLMLVFNVTSSQGQGQTVVFQWPPIVPTGSLPSPPNTSVFGGLVTYDWFTNSSGVYMTISTKG